MKTTKIPQRVFNSPLVMSANFEGLVNVNLIRLNKPYAGGISYAVYETANYSHQLCTTIEEATTVFNACIVDIASTHKFLKIANTGN